jgi:uncharacterized protein (TIGR00369 family)
MRFYNTAPGEITAHYMVHEQHQGYPGVVHGGIVASMLDEICGRVFMNADSARFMFTARLEVRYRKNVPVGKPLTLTGLAVRDRGRTAEAKAFIHDEQGNLLAEANALLVELSGDAAPSVDLEALGWKVYPE